MRRILGLGLCALCLVTLAGLERVWASVGPGTASAVAVRSFEPNDFDSLRDARRAFSLRMSSRIQDQLGFCKPLVLQRPRTPAEFRFTIRTPDDTQEPWREGESHLIEIFIRSSSGRLVRTPPLLELFAVGSVGLPVRLDLASEDLASGQPVQWVLPSLTQGVHYLHLRDRATGTCWDSDFRFVVAGPLDEPTPTPTATSTFNPTPTLTPTREVSATPTSTEPAVATPTATPTSTRPMPETPTPTPTRAAVIAGPPRIINDIGPGTTGRGKPKVFTPSRFASVRRRSNGLPSNLSPSLLKQLGECRDPRGGPNRSPVEFNLRITTPDQVADPWIPGESHEILILGRSSSLRWVETPPEIDLLLAGGPGKSLWLQHKYPLQVSSDPLVLTVPQLLPGVYRIHAFDRATGLCVASDFSFWIDGEIPRGHRLPDFTGDRRIDAVDLPRLFRALRMRQAESDLNDDGGFDFRDIFLFMRWWKRTGANPPPGL